MRTLFYSHNPIPNIVQIQKIHLSSILYTYSFQCVHPSLNITKNKSRDYGVKMSGHRNWIDRGDWSNRRDWSRAKFPTFTIMARLILSRMCANWFFVIWLGVRRCFILSFYLIIKDRILPKVLIHFCFLDHLEDELGSLAVGLDPSLSMELVISFQDIIFINLLDIIDHLQLRQTVDRAETTPILENRNKCESRFVTFSRQNYCIDLNKILCIYTFDL